MLGAIGGFGGANLLGTLGRLIEPLDYPRQALWNLVRSAGNAISGEGSADDLLRAIPGAMGVGLGGLIGGPLGILAGSALGGAAQGMGLAADPEKMRAPTAEDVTGSDSSLLNALVGMAGDPLTYAGGLGGIKAGRSAEAALAGRGATESAAQMLPLRRQFTHLNDVHTTTGLPLAKSEELMKTPAVSLASMEGAERGPLEGYIQTGFLGGGSPGQNALARPVGATLGSAKRASELRDVIRLAGQEQARHSAQGGLLRGFYDPISRSSVEIQQSPLASFLTGNSVSPNEVARHENTHGLIDRAVAGGDASGLPLSMRIPANLRMSGNDTLQGLGVLADEMAARGSGGGPGEVSNFLNNPMASYADRIRQLSPLIADLYGEGMIPKIPRALATLGLGGGGAGLATYLATRGE